jgi:formate-dependent nitrite reductase membrane component NrfD
MAEIDITGANPITAPELVTWGWPVAVYLFVGGLVGGLMIMVAVLRLRRDDMFARAIWIADLWALPLLSFGLLMLYLDLSYKVHAWRFFTTIQPTSAMSWGTWILLISGAVLTLRSCVQLPSTSWFVDERVPAFIRKPVEAIGGIGSRHSRLLDVVGIVVGASLAFYTGILLSTIPARPLWDSVVLAPLFLVSGIAAAGAFLCLFLGPEAHKRLTPTAIGLCAAELTLIGAFFVSLVAGTPATRRAAEILVSWPYGVLFWAVVIVGGLLVPLTIENAEIRRLLVPDFVSRSAPVLKLIGSFGLRFVIVLAGLQTSM